jgi:hypothetical protein
MRLVASFEKHHPMGRSKEHWSAEEMLGVRRNGWLQKALLALLSPLMSSVPGGAAAALVTVATGEEIQHLRLQ